jgi:hypothetical protein
VSAQAPTCQKPILRRGWTYCSPCGARATMNAQRCLSGEPVHYCRKHAPDWVRERVAEAKETPTVPEAGDR